jgi:subtilisin family serine protease
MGGEVLQRFEDVGVAVVSLEDDAKAEELRISAELRSVVPNVELDWLSTPEGFDDLEITTESIGDDEPGYVDFQWNMLAISAADAWDAGYTGAGVKIAVLDSGIDADHVDLAANINLAESVSFIPGDPSITDSCGHGTHVAGIIAAADNQIGVIGVAPKAELVAVRVFNSEGTGDLDWIIQGILYANAIGADVINMSFGSYVQRRGIYDDDGAEIASAAEVAEIVGALMRVINYVHNNGSLVVTSAGNESLDTTGDSGVIHLPSDAGQTLSVSATGPVGWAEDKDTDLDLPAFYTDYGSAIDVAAPGGNGDDSAEGGTGSYYDGIYSTHSVLPDGTSRWAWTYGTSQAAAHVAGVAALVIQAHAGAIEPAAIMDILKDTADDLGKPGRDPWYGHGRINAAAAVTQ